jgi:hypothetical protein
MQCRFKNILFNRILHTIGAGEKLQLPGSLASILVCLVHHVQWQLHNPMLCAATAAIKQGL